jgi:hypothetical protein
VGRLYFDSFKIVLYLDCLRIVCFVKTILVLSVIRLVMPKIRVGMSILSKRPRTLDNLRYLYEFSKQESLFDFVIYNKSELDLREFSESPNFSIQKVPFESLYLTMTRLSLDGNTHTLWLNDDDEFSLPTSLSLLALGENTVIYPEMTLHTTARDIKISWDLIAKGERDVERFLAYWNIAAPLFFCIIPKRIFEIWIGYIRSLPIHLPHLDTQLNLLVSIQPQLFFSTEFKYTYGAENWESEEQLLKSSLMHAEQFGKDVDFVFCMKIIRNIDNLCLLMAYSDVSDVDVSPELVRAVLRQFGPMQNGKRAWVVRNLFPLRFRRRYLFSKIEDLDFQKFLVKLPLAFQDFFLGAKLLKRPEDLLLIISNNSAGSVLQVPDEMIHHWKRCLTGKV